MTCTIIPENIKGKQTDLTTSVSFDTKEEAIKAFATARNRIRNPRLWQDLCGGLASSFALTTTSGVEVQRSVKVNDHFRIDIPGPGPIAGDGYDWVCVEDIEDRNSEEGDEELFAVKVRPCNNPAKPTDETAHFFLDSATSSFMVQRNGNTVTASYHGRNEVPNVKMDNPADSIRNTLVAAGAIAGLSEAQWYTLIKGFLAEGEQ